MGDRRFVVELIKPSHYDDDGYVIQWWKSWIPSNSLACLYGIASDIAARNVLGPDVALELRAYDECHTVIPIGHLIRRIKAADAGLVCLVGVQSNQFPRAMDLAAQFRAAGIAVAIGGFHVSGCLAMLPRLPPDLETAVQMGITLFAGEAEGRLEGLFADALAGRLQPIYNYMDDLPGLQRQVTPFLPAGDRAALWREPGRLRCRARLPVSVQLLHDHQCPGPEIALARRRRCRAPGTRQFGPGRLSLFHYRRQFRPQPQLGGDLRPADPNARTGRRSACNSSSRSTRSATASRILSRRRRAPAANGFLSASKTSTPTICCPPRKNRTGCTNTAGCSWPGGRSM